MSRVIHLPSPVELTQDHGYQCIFCKLFFVSFHNVKRHIKNTHLACKVVDLYDQQLETLARKKSYYCRLHANEREAERKKTENELLVLEAIDDLPVICEEAPVNNQSENAPTLATSAQIDASTQCEIREVSEISTQCDSIVPLVNSSAQTEMAGSEVGLHFQKVQDKLLFSLYGYSAGVNLTKFLEYQNDPSKIHLLIAPSKAGDRVPIANTTISYEDENEVRHLLSSTEVQSPDN